MENGTILQEKTPPSRSLDQLSNGRIGSAPPQPTQSTELPSSHQPSKREAIERACNLRDTTALASLATTSGGLVEDKFRRIAWPLLLGYLPSQNGDKQQATWKDLPRHRDEDQVKLDVDRAFVYYPNNQTEKELERKKVELSDLITAVLRLHPMLCYFQGYHDIVQVLLLVLGVHDAIPAVTRISLFRIRDYMLPNLSPAVTHLRLVPAILEAADAELCQHLSQTGPFFALSATLTLYAHDIQEYSDIARLFDFLLAHEPVVSLYLFVAIILSRKEELFDIPLDDPDMLHFTLSKLPNPLNLENLISRAMVVYERHPPEKLPYRAWRSISSNSVLKTSRKLIPEQPVYRGEELFGKQTQELNRQELRERAMKLLWMYRKPAGSIGIALVIGAMSYWATRTGKDRFLWSLFHKVWHAGRNGR